MKAALIMDMPKSCHECRFWFAKATDPVRYRCMAAQKYIENLGSKPDWCTLRELPKEMEVCGKYPQPGKPVPSYRIGWNDCLKAVTEINKKLRIDT